MSKKIKKETIYKTDYQINSFMDEEVEQFEFISAEREYDINGNTLIDISYDQNGDIIEKYVYRYDDKNRKVEEFMYLNEEEIAEHKTYEFNENDKISKQFIHYQEGGMDTINYSYINGQLVEKVLKDSDGVEGEREIIHWEDQKRVRDEKFNEDGDRYETNRYFYDEKGNLIKNIRWESDLDRDIIILFEYDENDNRTAIINLDSNEKMVARATYEFDEKNRIVSLKEENQYRSITTIYQFDNQDNIILEESTNENNEVSNRIERLFDENGNLIESKVEIDKHGHGINDDYLIRYEYEFFD